MYGMISKLGFYSAVAAAAAPAALAIGFGEEGRGLRVYKPMKLDGLEYWLMGFARAYPSIKC